MHINIQSAINQPINQAFSPSVHHYESTYGRYSFSVI